MWLLLLLPYLCHYHSIRGLPWIHFLYLSLSPARLWGWQSFPSACCKLLRIRWWFLRPIPRLSFLLWIIFTNVWGISPTTWARWIPLQHPEPVLDFLSGFSPLAERSQLFMGAGFPPLSFPLAAPIKVHCPGTTMRRLGKGFLTVWSVLRPF